MTKTMRTYNTVKEFILENRIHPGERIYIQDLSKRLNISTTPLREALNRLVQEGFVNHNSHRGYVLQVLTIGEVEKLYEFSEALETYAIGCAVKNVTPSHLADLQENLSRYKKSIEKSYSRERFVINNEFHLKIARLSGNEFIAEHVERILEKIALKWKLENVAQGRGPVVYDEHMAIYTSLERFDAESAIFNMRNHIINAKKDVLKILRMKEDLFTKG